MWNDKGGLELKQGLKFHFYISCLFLWLLLRNLDLTAFFFWSKYFCVVFILVSWCSVLFGSSVVLDLSYFHMETISHTQAYQFLYKFMMFIQGLKNGFWRYDTLRKGCLILIKVAVVGGVQSLNRVQLSVTLWTVAHQASLSLTISLSSPAHVHWISDAIQPSHPLLSPFPPFNLFHHQGLFQWVGCSHQVSKVLELQFQHQSFQCLFRVHFP